MKDIVSLNHQLYTDLPIDELEGRLAMEELEERLEMACWDRCPAIYCDGYGDCSGKYCSSDFCHFD
jgi:hypothetical protein